MSSKSPKWNSLGDFLKAKEERQKEEDRQEEPQSPVTDVTPVTPVTPVTRVRGDAAPKRDFTRSPNSIVRDAIPAGVFAGKCKHLYDFLYSQTRGAIVPTRSARLPTQKVMKGAGMTRHTFRAHTQRLIRFGLIEVEERPGEHGGNIYTIYLPEEVEIMRGDRGYTGDKSDKGHTGDKVPLVQGSQSDPGEGGLNAVNTVSSGQNKTSFKTNTERSDDDEAGAAIVRELKKLIEDITGREATLHECSKMIEVIEVIALEGKIAAARTTVSSAAPFLAEHLRRRLFKKNKQELAIETAQSVPLQPSLDASQCPDCGGVGWYYPQSKEKGIAKCKHARLQEGKTDRDKQ
jgi:hypothetical protein